jgi:transposase InsO family protein
MGRVGSSYDIALAESSFATLKRELLYSSCWLTRNQACAEAFSRLAWYSRHRRHFAPSYLSPADFERKPSTMDKLGLVA